MERKWATTFGTDFVLVRNVVPGRFIAECTMLLVTYHMFLFIYLSFYWLFVIVALKIKYWQQGKKKILFLWAYFEYFSHSSVPRFSKMSEGGVLSLTYTYTYVGRYAIVGSFWGFWAARPTKWAHTHTHTQAHGHGKRGSKTGVTILTITTSS